MFITVLLPVNPLSTFMWTNCTIKALSTENLHRIYNKDTRTTILMQFYFNFEQDLTLFFKNVHFKFVQMRYILCAIVGMFSPVN